MGTKLSLNFMKKVAARHGGVVMSKRYRNVNHKMRFRCKEGHTWWTYPYNINAGCWCPKCGDKKKGGSQKYILKDAKEFAKKQGGRCLSNEYENMQTKLIWKCKRGHLFTANFFNVKKRKNWCKTCARYSY